jgi:hypothetical protein
MTPTSRGNVNTNGTAHERWTLTLGRDEFRTLLERGEFLEVAARATRIEGRTKLLFSFEKMALRDAVRTPRARAGSRAGCTRSFTKWAMPS